jgi:hypothetical protein
MTTTIDQLSVVLTSFAYREQYFAELDGLLATVKEHHPDWPIVTGRGPVSGFELPTMEVESPLGKCHWSLPVSLNLDGSVDDWRKINKMKAWWMAEVFRNFGDLAGGCKRILWIDADARLNGRLDVELDPEAEVVAGPWWRDPRHPDYESIAGGFLLFQGASRGPVEGILRKWSDMCLAHIQKLPDPPIVPWGCGDMEVLNLVLKNHPPSAESYKLIELDARKYLGIVDHDGIPAPGALVDQWMMARKMKWPKDRDKEWPPPEQSRRSSHI